MRPTIWLSALTALALIASSCAGVSERADNRAAPSTEQRTASQPIARDAATAPQSAAALAGGQQASNVQAGAGAPAPADRKVIVNVTLDILVGKDGGQRRASITIRVPTNRYQAVLDELRGLGSVESERSSANDVSEEYTDLGSRLRNLEATEQQLLVFLGQAKNVQEVLTVQDRLNTVRAEIERVKGRIALLTRLTDLATIQVQLRPDPAPVTKGPSDSGAVAALRRGWQASLDVVGGGATALLTAAAFSWWLLPLGVAAAWIVRRELRRRGPRAGRTAEAA
jgi:hypothetical protein